MAMKRHLNFVPANLRPKIEVPYGIAPVVVFVLAASFVSISAMSLHSESKVMTEQLQALEVQNNQLLQKIQTHQGIQKTHQEVGELQKVFERKNYISELFKELSMLIPEDIWLTSFSKTSEVSGMNSLVIRGNASSQGGIADFLSTLERSEFFSNVRMSFSEKEKDIRPSRYRFEFTLPAELHMPNKPGGLN